MQYSTHPHLIFSHLLFSSVRAGSLKEQHTWLSASINRRQVPEGALHVFIGQPESAGLQPESHQRRLAGTHQSGGAAVRLQPVSQSQHHGHLQLPGEPSDGVLFHPDEHICTDTPRWSSGAAFPRGGLCVLPARGRQRSSAVSAGERPVYLLMLPIRPTEEMYVFREIYLPNARMYCNIMLIRDLKKTFSASFKKKCIM